MREKKKTIIRKKSEEGAAEEATSKSEQRRHAVMAEAEAEQPAAQVTSEAGLAAPQLHGKKRVAKGPKKFESTTDNKQTRIVEGGPELDEEKPDLDDGEPELED